MIPTADDQLSVWIYDPATQDVTRRIVTAGEPLPTGVPVTSGLQSGEQIVIAGAAQLQPGHESKTALAFVMPNIARFTMANPIYGWMLALTCLAGGLYGMSNISRLEDPNFPLGQAYIITPYPGASAQEVEQEVTDRIEAALQELPYLDKIESKSVPSRSEVKVELLENFGFEERPQIFDELRRRVSEAAQRLPPGAGTPLVEDDFSDVYGVLYFVSAPDYSDAEQHDMSRTISTRLKNIQAVAKVATLGVPQEAVYIELEHAKLTNVGLSIDDLGRFINAENQVIGAGSALFEGRRLQLRHDSALTDVRAVSNLKIGQPGTTQILRLGDIAEVKRTTTETPSELVRFNGVQGFLVGISVAPGNNVVEVGHAIDRQMTQLAVELPLGTDVQRIYAQHSVVELSIDTFLRNLLLSVATVVLALCLFMGWRAGAVVGAVLLLTVLGTIGIMHIAEIELQRISLGALMIAMGMLVDNAIVVAEGMLVGVRRGLSAEEAAASAVQRTQYSLLGATIIGILAFAPISLSSDNSGHFLISLFQVISISLLLSWVLAVTVGPMLGGYLLKPTEAVDEQDLYRAWYFQPYRVLMTFGLRRSWLTVALIAMITAGGLYSMNFVKTAFFPSTNTPMFFVDYFLQEGTDILTTNRDVTELESELLELTGIESVTTFVGRGPPRFASTISPEQPNTAYAHFLVRVESLDDINELMRQADSRLTSARPDADIRVSRMEFSPTSGAKIEGRFYGDDPVVLRELADQALEVYLSHQLIERTTNWRKQSLQLRPQFDEDNARVAGVSRGDLARSLAYNTLGVQIGLLRDADKIIPIIARAPDAERANLANLRDRQVWSTSERQYVPISQVVSGFDLEPANTTIHRRQRVRMISAYATPPPGTNTNAYFERVRGDVEAITLPPGYRFEWGGEFESNTEADEALTYRIPPAFALMFFITILLFGAIRQAVVIWLTVPMILCGVAIGLLVTDLPLTFPSFLGVLSLAGMLIKNCIVLVSEIDLRIAEREADTQNMMTASLSRLRPVMLASVTTVFGMSPLLTDQFFREMAVSIMSGLLFATLLTLVAVPVFYRIALGKRLTQNL